jgi:hypothetical protein
MLPVAPPPLFNHILLELTRGCDNNGFRMVWQLATSLNIPQVGGMTSSRHPSFLQLVAFD